MDSIDKSDLRDGDVILYNGNSWISRAIRFMDGTEVNHAALYLGEGRVAEAIAKGVTKRTFETSTADDRYVIIRRLSTQPETMQPVLEKAQAYLGFGNRYGYEQIVLLAFLGITRKLPVNAYLKWLLRKILDQAADLLMASGNKQPMICSEFVYRCFVEALPASTDPYTLRINTFPDPGIGAGTRDRVAAGAPHRARMHRDSLLTWAEEVITTRKKAGSDPLVMSLDRAKGAKGRPRLSAGDKKMAALNLDLLIERYLEETKKPLVRAFEAEASLRGPEMLAGIRNFAEAYYRATGKHTARAGESWSARAAAGEAPAALSHLLTTVENFVTPGDLLACRDLFQVARIDI